MSICQAATIKRLEWLCYWIREKKKKKQQGIKVENSGGRPWIFWPFTCDKCFTALKTIPWLPGLYYDRVFRTSQCMCVCLCVCVLVMHLFFAKHIGGALAQRRSRNGINVPYRVCLRGFSMLRLDTASDNMSVYGCGAKGCVRVSYQ